LPSAPRPAARAFCSAHGPVQATASLAAPIADSFFQHRFFFYFENGAVRAPLRTLSSRCAKSVKSIKVIDFLLYLLRSWAWRNLAPAKRAENHPGDMQTTWPGRIAGGEIFGWIV
jgi:hypothetical protein